MGMKSTTYYKRKKGQFIYSKLDFLNCAFGIIPEELDGYESTLDLPCFDINDVDPYYLLACVTQKNFYLHFGMIADGGRKARRVGPEDMLSFTLAYPPLKEQQKIAEILSTQDKIIVSIEKLIAEKKRQKKHLMQRLLTGSVCLPGFVGEWKKILLGKVIEQVSVRNTGNIVNNVMSVSNERGFILQSLQFDKVVASKDTSNYKIVKKDVFAYNPSRINVGSIAKYDYNEECIISPMYITFIAKEINCEYLIMWLKSSLFKGQLKRYLSGSVRDSLNYNDLELFKIDLPTKEEQIAIAEGFLKADEEIELLQKELEQEKHKKKALTQLLLTGIVRV